MSGFLFTAATLADHWQSLDEFEGPGYERVLTEAVNEDGVRVETWVYVDRSVV